MLRQLAKLGLLMAAVPTFAFAALPTAPVQIHHGFFTGNSYRTLRDEPRSVYIAGVIDGFHYAPMFGAESKDVWPLGVCIEGMNSAQVMFIVDRYIANNPAIWGNDMNTIVYDAMKPVCVKRGRPF